MTWRRSTIWAISVPVGWLVLIAVLDRQWPDRGDLVQAVLVFAILMVLNVIERIVLSWVDARRARQEVEAPR